MFFRKYHEKIEKKLDIRADILYTTTCKEKNFTGGVFLEESQDILDRVVELSLLYDFYGNLLKEQKRKIFEDYVLNDYSLSEVAGIYGMSRQGIHDTIKRCIRELEDYEKNLCLLTRFQRIREKLGTIEVLAEQIRDTQDVELADTIHRIAKEIMDVL